MQRIVVLGAGYGGILTAKKLARRLKNNTDVQIQVIDKNTFHTMLTELHEVACERVPEDAIRINLEKVFAGRKIDLVHDEIQNIDFNKQQLTGKKGEYAYDYLVMGSGSKPTFFGTKGAAENAYTLWSYEDAVEIKNQIRDMFHQASVELDPVKRQQMLTFVVIGCGFTGIEMIGELAEWRDRLCRQYHIDEKDVTLHVADMLPKILPIFDQPVIDRAEKYLRKMNVDIILSAKIVEVAKDAVVFDGREAIKTNTAIWAAGIEGSDIMGKVETQKQGRNRLQTNSYLQSLDHENVYAVGDNIFYIAEGEERPVPQMVENAEHSAETVAANIVAAINKQPMESYKPAFHGAMVCIGGRYGVAQLNTKSKKFYLYGFFAMFIKHFINLVYFVQVAGLNKVWTYLVQEIFHIDDRRAFTGGFLSKRTPNFWLVPLRIFLGYKWLSQGWSKFTEHTLKDFNEMFLIPAKNMVGMGGGFDATSGASAAETTGEAVSQWGAAIPVPDFIKTMSDWFMDLMFYTPDGGFTWFAPVFQFLMVVAEIAVGVGLIIGLFTFLSSVVSIGMSMIIWVSGMAPLEMWWYFFAAIAVMFGSGSTFGLDYWVIPALKEWWSKLGFVKKWYLFTDRVKGW